MNRVSVLPANAAQSGPDLVNYYINLEDALRDREFVDTATAARRVGVSQRTIEAWIDAGLIRAIFIGKKYKVQLESLYVYVRSHALQRAS
jgi:excisionase family DNA binding protein